VGKWQAYVPTQFTVTIIIIIIIIIITIIIIAKLASEPRCCRCYKRLSWLPLGSIAKFFPLSDWPSEACPDLLHLPGPRCCRLLKVPSFQSLAGKAYLTS
jgi:hypothetical protein